MASKKRDPNVTYSSGGKLYGPGQPKGFSVADLDKISPLKAQEEDEPEMNENPTETGEVSKSGEPVSHPSSSTPSALTEESLEAMDKSELEALATQKGITVTRQDGKAGAPTKPDYVAALAGK